MPVDFLPNEGLPRDLNQFRTLVAQNRGCHFNFLNGLEYSFFDSPLNEPYYTGLTVRIFGWLGDATGSLAIELNSKADSEVNPQTAIEVKGDEVAVTFYYNRLYTKYTDPKPNYPLQFPGYLTMALRLEMPSSVQAILGENELVRRAEWMDFSDGLWEYRIGYTGSAKLLSLHVSDEEGKSSSRVILRFRNPDLIWFLDTSRSGFLVIECHVDISQDVVVTFFQLSKGYVEVRFPTSGLQKNDEGIITLRNTPDGWLVGTSFSPEYRLVKRAEKQFQVYPKLSGNCSVHRMCWEWSFV